MIFPGYDFAFFDFEGVYVAGESSQAFYIASPSLTIIAGKESNDPIATNDHMSIRGPARFVEDHFGAGFSDSGGESISW